MEEKLWAELKKRNWPAERQVLDQAMAKYNVLTRRTVRKWLDRVRHENFQHADFMNQAPKQPPPMLVEQMAHKADELAGRVKQMETELEQSQIQVFYYTTVIRVTEKDLGIALWKKAAVARTITQLSNSRK